MSALRGPAALLAMVVLLAGCLGSPGPAADGTAATTTPESPTTNTTTTETTTSTVSVDGEIVPYTELSAEQQAVFDELLENGSVEGPPPEFHDLSEGIEYVRHEGTVYHIVVEGQTGHIAQYHLDVDRRLDESELGDDRQVKNASALDPAAREIFLDAIAGNDSEEPYGPDEFPEVFGEGYVFHHNGTYYDLEVAHGDIWVYEISIEAVS